MYRLLLIAALAAPTGCGDNEASPGSATSESSPGAMYAEALCNWADGCGLLDTYAAAAGGDLAGCIDFYTYAMDVAVANGTCDYDAAAEAQCVTDIEALSCVFSSFPASCANQMCGYDMGDSGSP